MDPLRCVTRKDQSVKELRIPLSRPRSAGLGPGGGCVRAHGSHASVNFKPSFLTSKPTGPRAHLSLHLSRVQVVCFRVSRLPLAPISTHWTNMRTHKPKNTSHGYPKVPPTKEKPVCIKFQKRLPIIDQVNAVLICYLPGSGP
jgi:hypothetical protein